MRNFIICNSSSNIIGTIKLRKMNSAGHVVPLGENNNAYCDALPKKPAYSEARC
jgi:hypothetical protein